MEDLILPGAGGVGYTQLLSGDSGQNVVSCPDPKDPWANDVILVCNY